MAYRFWKIVEGPDVIDNGQLYWLCHFWPDKASYDRGERPSVVEDFRTNRNLNVGKQEFSTPRRVNRGVEEVQLADDSWVAWEDWLLDRQPRKRVPGRVLDNDWLRDRVVDQIRAFASKPGVLPRKRVDRRWVNRKGRHPTRSAPDEVREMPKEQDEDAR